MYSSRLGRRRYFSELPSISRALYAEVVKADVVHAGPSQLFQPFEFLSLAMGWWLKKLTISHTDIDNRRSAQMNFMTGKYSRRQYWTTLMLHNSAIHLQHIFCARACSLVLLKGQNFCDDYRRRKKNNVKNFLDSAFSKTDIIPSAQLERKISHLKNHRTPVDITYFGRFVEYKGVDHMLRAIAHAKARGLADFKFHIIGDGVSRPQLETLASDLGLGEDVVFYGALPFGKSLFEKLFEYHLLLAAPLSEDTPRSALDAMASGEGILSYDTYYYSELQANSGAIETVEWRNEVALGERLFALCHDRIALTDMIRRGRGVCFK